MRVTPGVRNGDAAGINQCALFGSRAGGSGCELEAVPGRGGGSIFCVQQAQQGMVEDESQLKSKGNT